MATDPVCGKSVYEKIAGAGYSYRGHIHYFCGSDCKEKFVKSPAQYLKGLDCVWTTGRKRLREGRKV